MKTDLKSGLILTIAGTGVSGWSGDGAVASAACLNEPKSVTLDAEGNLFIADSENHIVRKIDRKYPHVSQPLRVWFSRLTQGRHPFCRLRRLRMSMRILLPETSKVDLRAVTQQTDLSGTVRYIAVSTAPAMHFSGDGGPADHALLNFPTAVVVDRAGHLYIADTLNHRVRRVDAVTRAITTVAGLGKPRYSGDGGLAEEAGLNEPAALSVKRRRYPLHC